MDFLYDIALPQPAEHFQLLLFILNLVYVVFFPYLAFLLGTAALAWYGRKKGRRGDERYFRLAHQGLDLALNTKSQFLFLGLIPSLSLVFLYGQILQGTGAIAAGVMFFACLAIWVGGALLYGYKVALSYGFLLEGQRNTIGRGGEDFNLGQLYERNLANQQRLLRYGLLLLAVGSVLSVGALVIAENPDAWLGTPSVFGLLLLPVFWVKLGAFLATAMGATGVGMLFFSSLWEGKKTAAGESSADLIRQVGLKLASIAVLLLPLFLLLGITTLPAASLSGSAYGLSGVSIVILVFTALFLYAFRRDGKQNMVAYAFYSLGVSLVLTFTVDQIAVRNATALRAVEIARVAEGEIGILKAKLGVAGPSLTGAEIYSGRCSACHLFDQKKVGPPYNVVIAKYAGRKGQLVAFILNPVKVDPAFPPMPNQGLRPSEADSIATYLLNRVGAAQTPAQAPVRGGGEGKEK